MQSAQRLDDVLLVTGIALAVTACNTVQGVGRDIESVGRKGEEVIK